MKVKRKAPPSTGIKKEAEAEIVTFSKYFNCSFIKSWVETTKQIIIRECENTVMERQGKMI